MKPKDELQSIPRNGRIGRFAKIVEKRTSEDIYLRILQNSSEYEKYKPKKKAQWWKNATERLEKELGSEKAIEIMRTCGSKCCGQGQRKTAKRLMKESSSIEDFLKKLSKYEVKNGELEYKLINDNTIIGKHNICFCGQVKKSTELFKNKTYCQCSVEFNKQFFESAFEKPVEVELKQSILNGGDFCEFEIKINN
jgi:predicted ArsR family transcriptional regulator